MLWSLTLGAILTLLVPGDAPAPAGMSRARADSASTRAGLDIPLLGGPTPTDPRKPQQAPRAVPPPQAAPRTPAAGPSQAPILEPPHLTPAAPTARPGAPAETDLDPLRDVPLLDQVVPEPGTIDEEYVPPLLGLEGPSQPAPARAPLRPGTLSLDIVPDDAMQPGASANGASSGLRPLPASPRPRRTLEEEDDFRQNDDDDDTPPLEFPRRRGGLFQRLFNGGNNPRNAVPPPREEPPASRRDEGDDVDRDLNRDPEVDLLFRRKLDRAVRMAGAPHIKSQEILVRDRKVWIRLKADRFWNRRALRRSIESLPVLAGYDVRLDVE